MCIELMVRDDTSDHQFNMERKIMKSDIKKTEMGCELQGAALGEKEAIE